MAQPSSRVAPPSFHCYMAISITVFLLSFVLIIFAGGLLPRALSGVARILQLSQFITAFLLVSFATSIPELFIGISSAVQDIPGISLGNILGANLVNITLKVSLVVFVAGTITGAGKISSQNFWLVFFISLLPILLASDGIISRGDGILLLAAFVLYVVKIFQDKEYFHKHMHPNEHPTFASLAHIIRYFGMFLVSMSLVLAGSFLLIWSAKEIVSVYFDAHYILFGIIILALGTTLPELIFGIRVALAGHGSAMLGNTLGAVAYNSAGIVGIVALINPITLDFTGDLFVVGIFLFIAFALFHFFVYTKHKINRTEALVLLLVYGAFLFLTISECVSCLLK